METNDSLISPATLDGEKGYENSLRPKKLDEYIGQEKIKNNLSIFIEAAKKEVMPLIMFFFMALPVSEKQHSRILCPERWGLI